MKYACEFRNALDDVVTKKLYGRLNIFSGFPDGCCTYTSDLLASYLLDKGFDEEKLQVYSGETYKKQYTHCWLTVNNQYFVDITADQFNNKPFFEKYKPIPKINIVPCYSFFYECFDKRKTTIDYSIGIEFYNYDVKQELKEIYGKIIDHIG